MKIYLIGMGCGTSKGATAVAIDALKNADLIIGAPRLLEDLGDEFEARKVPAILAKDIAQVIDAEGDEKLKSVAIAYSGDSGFYSDAEACFLSLRERVQRFRFFQEFQVFRCFLQGFRDLGTTGICSRLMESIAVQLQLC